MKNNSATNRTRLFMKQVITGACLALAVPLATMGQETVFNDTFGTSTLNQTNITGGIPGGIPTASWTSYTIGSSKNATATSITSGNFKLVTSATSSGFTEGEAVFTKYPVTLASVGDYVELDYTFTATTNILNGTAGGSVGPYLGLYNSGQVAPYSGTVLWNGGESSSSTTAATGHCQNWVGFVGNFLNSTANGAVNYGLLARPAQSGANNLSQALLYQFSGGSSLGSAAPPSYPYPNLTVGQQYTVQFLIALSAPGTLSLTNTMYQGAGFGGTVIMQATGTASGANFLTTNFDGLSIGYRAGTSPGVMTTNDINSITVRAGLAAQAGPYYFVTSSGDPCAGGLTIGLSGSVTTNDYLLYFDGAYTGQTMTGTGSPISFGLQSAAGTYTVIASNTVTTSVGPMYGSASVFTGSPQITSEPVSLTLVSNVTAFFSVSAIGNALTYQWYKNGVALTNGGEISGAQTTNLVIAPTGAADVGGSADGYYVVAQDPCGNSITSTPNASLTLVPPHNLIWKGGNPDDSWDHSTMNFTDSGNPAAFGDGDDVTFDDSSANTAVTMVDSNLVSTLVTVNASQNYTFNGTGKLTGFGQLVDRGSGQLTIVNNNDFTGGTVVSNGATLSLGDGTSIKGTVAGNVDVETNSTLDYYYAGPGTSGAVTMNNTFSGNGTINFNDVNGSTIVTKTTAISSNFSGTINVQGYTCLHAADGNAGYNLGNGSTVNVPSGTQVWLDRTVGSYNNTFNIAGTGWQGASPQTGALRLYGNIVSGPINLTANARIGGTINGATLQGVISGPYQLEIWGNTNSYVLVMGPTNGSPQAYASTLITAGAISAANSNAISSGPLTLDSGGDMRLNGHDITVASLSSVDSGQITLIEGPRVRNMNTTNAATLTVGTDGSGSEFDGTFSDGAAAPLGLTKVGAGTLTLTGTSTNKGAVTVMGGAIAMSGSGSFNNASAIAIGSGAFYDVSAAGGTLTLNAGQTLAGNGTLTGTLAAAAGSTVAPGFPLGMLTVSGGGTVGGTYRAALNRTNSAGNCSTLAASGGAITFSGATLTITNVGPKLQVGDAFQLFTGATAGFSASQLPTNDVPNNAVYTWNNTVASDGRITVATVSTLVNTTPTNVVTSVTGGSLNLSWPTDHTGWTLQAQTNAPGAGLGTNWIDVTGSAATNQMTVPVNSTNGNVFFRLIYRP